MSNTDFHTMLLVDRLVDYVTRNNNINNRSFLGAPMLGNTGAWKVDPGCVYDPSGSSYLLNFVKIEIIQDSQGEKLVTTNENKGTLEWNLREDGDDKNYTRMSLIGWSGSSGGVDRQCEMFRMGKIQGKFNDDRTEFEILMTLSKLNTSTWKEEIKEGPYCYRYQITRM